MKKYKTFEEQLQEWAKPVKPNRDVEKILKDITGIVNSEKSLSILEEDKKDKK